MGWPSVLGIFLMLKKAIGKLGHDLKGNMEKGLSCSTSQNSLYIMVVHTPAITSVLGVQKDLQCPLKGWYVLPYSFMLEFSIPICVFAVP
jgi:hypothetical protein